MPILRPTLQLMLTEVKLRLEFEFTRRMHTTIPILLLSTTSHSMHRYNLTMIFDFPQMRDTTRIHILSTSQTVWHSFFRPISKVNPSLLQDVLLLVLQIHPIRSCDETAGSRIHITENAYPVVDVSLLHCSPQSLV